jgi:hypothetical protein
MDNAANFYRKIIYLASRTPLRILSLYLTLTQYNDNNAPFCQLMIQTDLQSHLAEARINAILRLQVVWQARHQE